MNVTQFAEFMKEQQDQHAEQIKELRNQNSELAESNMQAAPGGHEGEAG